jgi:propanol-preferring alcohol dehydrogenase
MKAWQITEPGPVENSPLKQNEIDLRELSDYEILVQVSVCGVCRTDLHVVEGDLSPKHSLMTPGHEIIGTVKGNGGKVDGISIGDKVGIAWLYDACGTCYYCIKGDENLCDSSHFTGWDKKGGYADFVIADSRFVYKLTEDSDDINTAPLLCAGIIGYRSLIKSGAKAGDDLALFGYGGSAHIVSQIATASGINVHVVTRSKEARNLALDLGAKSVFVPQNLNIMYDKAIYFAPNASILPLALSHLRKSGTLVIAGIYLSELTGLDYYHHLYFEKQIVSATANTRFDGLELLKLAKQFDIKITTKKYSMKDAPAALDDLKHSRFAGAAVLIND